MRFDIVRQPLIPAFLSLALLTAVGLGCAAAGTLPADPRWGLSAEALPLLPADSALRLLQHDFPLLARLLAGAALLLAGTSLGRLTVRYNFYGNGTCLAMPLFGTAMLGCLRGDCFLTAVVCAALLVFSVRNFCYGYQNGFGFDPLFRGALFLGLLLLTEPAAAPLVLLLPAAIVRFRRTGRELLVAAAGLLLPPLALAYLNWAFGGTLAAPFEVLWHRLAAGSWGALYGVLTPAVRLFTGVVLAAALVAMLFFRANSYNVGTKARHMLIFASRLWLLTLFVLPVPGASAAAAALPAVPSALLLPVLFIRIRRPAARLLYPLWVAGTLAVLFAG